MAYTQQQYLQGIQRAREQGDTEAVEYLRSEAIKAGQAEEKQRFAESESNRSIVSRGFANLGAGFDSAWQGAKQIVGRGATDEEIKEKRQRDTELADTMPMYAGNILQIAGEVAPAVALGGAVGVGARALPAAVQASRGMQVASRVAGSPVGRGALEGAGAAALMPTLSDESRLQNMALGGATGAAAPYVLKAAMAGGRGVRNVAQRVASALPGEGGWGAENVAARSNAARLAREGIDEASVQTPKYVPDAFLETKPSAAVTFQDPKIASMEMASRQAARDEWVPHDTANQAARWRHLDENLQGPQDVQRLLGEANQIGAEVPYAATGPRLFQRQVNEFATALEQAKGSPQYHGNPAVRSAVDYVSSAMRNADEVTPELVHQMKQTLSRGLTGAPGAGEAGVRAAASEPFVIDIVQSLDNILANSSKGGKWDKWKANYGNKMTEAEAAKADANIRGKFVDDATGVLRKPGISLDNPGEPVVTAHALKQAVAAAGSAKRGPKKGQNLLRKESERALGNVTQDLEAQGILGRVRAASTPSGGSDTAANMGTLAALEMVAPGGSLLHYLLVKRGAGNISRTEQRQLAALLQDPEALRGFLRQQALRQADQSRLRYTPGAGLLALPAMD